MTPAIHLVACRLTATLIALCVTGCAAFRVPAPARVPVHHGDPVLAVVSWNLHGGRGRLAQFVGDLRDGRFTATPPTDYVLLAQELTTGGERDVLAETAPLGLATYFAAVRRDEPRQSGNAILSTRALAAASTIELPRERQPRGAVLASLEVAGARLFVVSAHLENRIGWTRGGLFSEGARGRQAAALINALPAERPGIVGADLNTWLGPTEPAWRTLLQRFPDTPAERPQPTFRDRLVLDHLFFDLPDGWTATSQVIPERYGSDHHPVLGLVYASVK